MTPTSPRGLPMIDMQAAAQISQLETNCRDFGIHPRLGSDTQDRPVIGPSSASRSPA
jgi:hypothetical protein